MELQDLVVVNVNTLDKTSTNVKVTVPAENGKLSAEIVHRKVCVSLGLKQSSFPYFSLFEESESHQILRRIKDTDTLPYTGFRGLCFRKWCFNKKVENTILQTDDVAAHLLYLEAEYNIDEGKLQPSKEQEQKLDELTEPGFVLDKQYVGVCHQIKDYFTVCVRGCRVHSFPSSSVTQQSISKDHTMVKVSTDGIHLESDINSLQIPWFCVRDWTIYPSVVKYKYYNSDGQDWTLSIATDQLQYLVSAVNEMLTVYKVENEESAAFLWSMVSKTDDGGTMWQNAVFSLEKAKKHYNT